MNLEHSILIQLSKIYIATPFLEQNTNLPTLWKENKEEATLATMCTVLQNPSTVRIIIQNYSSGGDLTPYSVTHSKMLLVLSMSYVF